MGKRPVAAVLSDRPQMLYSYFKQLFAQVTTRRWTPTAKNLVMSAHELRWGGQKNLLDETPEHVRQVKAPAPHPFQRRRGSCARWTSGDTAPASSHDLAVADGEKGLEKALGLLAAEAERGWMKATPCSSSPTAR